MGVKLDSVTFPDQTSPSAQNSLGAHYGDGVSLFFPQTIPQFVASILTAARNQRLLSRPVFEITTFKIFIELFP
jgi:hypothetical protein